MLMKVLKKETFWIHGAFLGGLVWSPSIGRLSNWQLCYPKERQTCPIIHGTIPTNKKHHW
jgi:hypothetical protein